MLKKTSLIFFQPTVACWKWVSDISANLITVIIRTNTSRFAHFNTLILCYKLENLMVFPSCSKLLRTH